MPTSFTLCLCITTETSTSLISEDQDLEISLKEMHKYKVKKYCIMVLFKSMDESLVVVFYLYEAFFANGYSTPV